VIVEIKIRHGSKIKEEGKHDNGEEEVDHDEDSEPLLPHEKAAEANDD